MLLPWEIKITKVENGYTICWVEETDDGATQDKMEVIEIANKERGEVEAHRDLLWVILEHFGVFGNKYDKEQIRISIKHGRGYECRNDNCDICEEDKK